MKTAGSVGANAWQDIVVYILGPEADPTECPALRVNGSTDNPGGYTFYADGLRATGPYIRLRVLNYNGSGYGDSSTTTLYVTDFQVSRINGSGELYAALQVESSTRATDLNEVTATYTVKAELNSGGQPYVTGFGLMSSIINDAPTSAFGIRADQFFIARPDDPADTIPPFVAGDVDGTYTIGIDGQLIIDGTIYASSIVAASIGGRELNVDSLSAVSGNMGTLIAGLLTTAGTSTPVTVDDYTYDIYATDEAAWRVEIQDTAATAFPIWYGQGAKSANNGRFYVTSYGNVIVKGELNAGMIRQSFFTPAEGNSSFRVACDYPNNYSGGIYTGKSAHLCPVLTTGYSAPAGSRGVNITATFPKNNTQSKQQFALGYTTDPITVYSPTNSNTKQYGRLGTLSENLTIRYSATIYNDFSDFQGWAILQYRYDGGTWKNAYILHSKASRGGRLLQMTAEDIFITRETAWDTLEVQLGLGCEYYDEQYSPPRGSAQSVNLTVSTANFGYADLADTVPIEEVEGATTGSTTIARDTSVVRRYS
jgi:hypothetical protein